MPYINEESRERLSLFQAHALAAPIRTDGELVYALTQVIEGYRANHGTNFSILNQIGGALDNTKDEFRRRIQHPYENGKKMQNGDVYIGAVD